MVKNWMMIQKSFCRQLALAATFTVCIIAANAQYNITALLPSGSIYMRSQLWLLSISNTGKTYVQAKMQLELKDLDTRQTVLTAVTGNFTIPPGVKNIDAKALQPVQYNGSTGMIDQSPNSLLPPGRFRLCYQLYIIAGETVIPAADDCQQIEIEPLSPPILTSPENDSVITVATPNFTWVPPAPVAMFTNLNYAVQVTEVYDGQSVNDAIQKNLPLQQAQGIQQPFFTYPILGPQLENGKKYAWQVIAKDQQKFAARSEVWVFKIREKKTVSLNNNNVYLLMDERSQGTASVAGDTLHIKYVSSASAHQVPLIIKDAAGQVLATIKQQLKQGDNFLDIPLNNRFSGNEKYTVLITDINGKTSSVTFTIK